jgi:aryl-alcohol dehydrogenase-like predicted oxidoreductase
MQLILGTAQLGLNYGITNITGKPELNESLEIIEYALNNNIDSFDTARAYGNSEYILGLANKKYNNLNIITKLDPLSNINEYTSNENIYKMIDESINTSLKNLNINIIDTLLLHRFDHFHNKIIWNYLLEKKKLNKIKKLGVSIYYVEEAIEALKDNNIEHIQLPINILDNQWFCDDFLQLLEKRTDVIIHCRSILLQGILISDADKWPKIDNNNPEEFIKKLNELVKLFKLNSRLELCFSYVKSIEWIDGLLIGVDNINQLNENLKLFNVRKLTNTELNLIKTIFKGTSNKLLNPALW